MSDWIGGSNKLKCGNCGGDIKTQTTPDGGIMFSCKECGGQSLWKTDKLISKTEGYLPCESTEVEFTETVGFTKIEKSIVSIAIIILFFGILLSFQ